MMPTVRTWGEVIVGTYVRDKNGVVYRVEDEKNGWLLLVKRDGTKDAQLRPPPGAPVTVMVPTIAEATETIATHLGGTIIRQE